MKLARKILFVSFALVAVAVLAAVFLSERLLSTILSEQIAAKSGLHTQLTATHFDIWPGLRIRIIGLQLSNPDAAGHPPVFAADELAFTLPYADLISGAPKVTDVALKRPVLRLAEAVHAPKPADKAVPSTGHDVAVNGPFTVSDGVIIDDNERRHASGRVDAINLRAQEMHDGAIALSLDARVGDKNLHADAKAASAADLFGGRQTRIDVAATTDPHAAASLNVHTILSVNRSLLTFDDVAGTWQDGRVNASGNVRFGGEVPVIKADVRVDRVNFGSFDSADAKSSTSDPASDEQAPLSDTPMDTNSMRLVDVSLDLKAGELRADGLRVTNVGLRTTLDDGILRVALKPTDFYQGKVSADLLIDASQDMPTQAMKFSFADVQAVGMLSDLNGFRQFDGKLQMSAQLESSGASLKAIVANLSGSADLSVKDGAITGQKLPDLFRSVSAYLPQAWQDLNDKITISSVTTKFAVTNGTATTDDLRVLSPVANIDGKGKIDLVARTFDLRFDPQIKASEENATKKINPLDLGAAILVRGPWSNPEISADLSDMMRDPQKTLGKLQGLGEQLLGNSDKSSKLGSDDVMNGISNLMKGLGTDNLLGGH